MNLEFAKLIHQAEQVLDQDCADKAAALLQDSNSRLVDGAPTREEVQALLPTLKARLENSAHTGVRIYGATQLIAKLEEMPVSKVIIGYGFISAAAAGNFYLAHENGPVIGAAIVDR